MLVNDIDAVLVAKVGGYIVGNQVNANEVYRFVAMPQCFLAAFVGHLSHHIRLAKVVGFPYKPNARLVARNLNGLLACIYQAPVHCSVRHCRKRKYRCRPSVDHKHA